MNKPPHPMGRVLSSSSSDVATVLLGSLAGPVLNDEEHNFFQQCSPAGITLFSRNIVDEAQLGSLTAELQSYARSPEHPLIIAIDQEGGRVARIKAPFPNQGPALQLADGRADHQAQEQLAEYGAAIGCGLRARGVNVNFAPVLDILHPTTHVSIGDRAFARSPVEVSIRAHAFLRGMQREGVLGCLKHFPGQGAGNADTHFQATVITKSRSELQSWDLVPFEALLPHIEMVMLSHCIYPSLDQREASVSSEIIEGLLRRSLGFKGVAVSDDMTMAAVHKAETPSLDHIIAAIESGIDLVLICKDIQLWRAAYAALCQHAEESPAFRKRLRCAAGRVARLRARLGTER